MGFNDKKIGLASSESPTSVSDLGSGVSTDTDALKIRVPTSRLDKACNYLSNKWFPCSPITLELLDKLVLQNKANPDLVKSTLNELVRKDYSLALYLHKELSHFSNQEPLKQQENSPADLIENSEVEVLLAVIRKSLPILRLHSVQESKDYQIKKLEEVFIALITTKKLCAADSIDPDLGAEVSLFRQLGYLLVAWNYPTIYQSAVKQSDEKHSVDDNLLAALGFSPTALALSLAERWGLGTIFKDAVNPEQDCLLAPNETKAVAKSISKLCGIGEKLARASNPSLYPSALHDWDDAKKVITAKLGSEGLRIIDQAMTEECEDLFVKSPFIFKPGTISNLDASLTAFQIEKNAVRNPHINSCSKEMKKQMLILYNLISAGQKAETTVAILLQKILPLAGFNSSALFTLDPGNKKLALQLKSGDIKLRTGSNCHDFKHKDAQDIVPLAFHSPEVLEYTPSLASSQDPACLATFFGCSQRFGVFYVELPAKVYKDNKLSCQEKLKAMVFALNDCLELS